MNITIWDCFKIIAFDDKVSILALNPITLPTHSFPFINLFKQQENLLLVDVLDCILQH